MQPSFVLVKIQVSQLARRLSLAEDYPEFLNNITLISLIQV
jgi:hypothetical protein